MNSFKGKLRTLNKVLQKYAKAKGCKVRCYMEYEFLIIHFDIKNGVWESKTIKIPSSEISKTIKQYRELARYEKSKLSENINKAILEEDIMNYRDKLKVIMK